ncbi:MAG: GNAT family N-acetyltransferase, partial [Anaerolineales bacterium]|nr:GNAT family N-acetyltransferase [Anaerolineales bacterium]
ARYREEETAVMLGAFSDAALGGFVIMHPLAWDTAHFGINVWRLVHFGVWGSSAQQREVACALAQAAVSGATYRSVQIIHVWIPLDAIPVIHMLEAVGFRTMESQVYWLFDLQQQPLPAQQTDAVFRPHTPDDVEALVALAGRVYAPIPNRFYADPHLPTAACDDLYAKWLRNSCSGEAADYVSVIDVRGAVAGYGTLRYLDNHSGLCNVRMGQFLLGAIDPDFRQKGLYEDMMRSLLVWLADRQADVAFVGTQTNNAAAQAGMVRMGWRPVTGGLSLHCWLGG